jgi:hypothetical protein
MRWGSSLFNSCRDAYDACATDFLSGSGTQPIDAVLRPDWPGGWPGLEALVAEATEVWWHPCECDAGCPDCRDEFDRPVWSEDDRYEFERALIRVLGLSFEGNPPVIIPEAELPRPYYCEDGSFDCAILPGNPHPSRVVCVFADFEGDGEYSCPADEVGQRGNRSQRLDALVRVEITPPKQVMKSYKITSADGVDLGLYYGVDEAGALDALARDAGYEDMADALARGIPPFHGSVTEEVDPLPWLQEMK